MFCLHDRSRQQGLLPTSVLILSVFLTSGVIPAQVTFSSSEGSTVSRAYVDYLQALGLANDGSKPEALRLLADSLRLQPQEIRLRP
jgi:hypothetical protein